jgi:ADP-ribosyl-[dinitrogen reductase] hydrolase
MEPANRAIDATMRSRYRGCLLGGAVGDALGAPVEFMRRDTILSHHGPNGLSEMVPAYGKRGAITDDTQMMLFTAEGLLQSHRRDPTLGLEHSAEVIANAYLRWLHTQDERSPVDNPVEAGGLLRHPELFSRRAPGVTCLSALKQTRKPGTPASNDSKGCGGVMRVAPVGMMLHSLSAADPQRRGDHLEKAFDLGCVAAGLTHGHPTGQLASGAFSAIVFMLLDGGALEDSTAKVLEMLDQRHHGEETAAALRLAVRLASEQPASPEAITMLGEGWIAEEALAIGLYCALGALTFESGVVLAINHDGDSDSTGLIAGHLLGAMNGMAAIPERWLEPLELRIVLDDIADELVRAGCRESRSTNLPGPGIGEI